jgi:regulator of protease activity HflC (stomatin/prohibitin superfamily)
MKKIVIGSTERGILYKDKRFERILAPGSYRFLNPLCKVTVAISDIAKEVELRGPIAQLLANRFTSELAEFLVKVETGPREVAVVYLNSQASCLVMPSEERLFWRGLAEINVKRFEISDGYELDRETVRNLSVLAADPKILRVSVPEQCRGLLLESGVIVRELAPGHYAFWRAQRDLSVSILDTRLTALEVSGQEMLTKDKVSLRVNLSVSYRLVDAVKATRALSDIQGEIYRCAQLALRQAVGEKTLDELLENKELLNRVLASEIKAAMEVCGIEIVRIGVKDLILPGEMRALLNQVVEAEKAAQAQNIRRREETAATRSLMNTARMMENNPVLLRLKELEAVERISEKVGKLTVYDGLDGVMKGLVSLTK